MVKLGSVRVQPVGLGLAPTIDRRLDQLLYLAHEAGHQTTRHRIVGALIRESPTEPGELVALLSRYEGAEAEEAVIPGVSVPGSSEVKGPGRRKVQVGNPA